MRKRSKKYLSLFLAAVLSLGLVAPSLSVTASAEDITGEIAGAAVEQIPTEEAAEQVLTEEMEASEEKPNSEEAQEETESEEQSPSEEMEDSESAQQTPAQEAEGAEAEGAIAAADLESYTLTLDANGGSVTTATVTVTHGCAIGELPEATRTGYSFVGWKLEDGTTLTAATIYSLEEDATAVAQWVEQPATPTSSNTTYNLITFHCTSNEDHADLFCNMMSSYVKYKAGTLSYDEERGVFTATLTITSVTTLTGVGTKAPDKTWGNTHYHNDANGNKASSDEIQVVWDPTATGLSSTSKQTTGMWVPDGDKGVVNVFCYTAPEAPSAAAIASTSFNLLWIRNTNNTAQYLKQTKLIAGTYEVSELQGNAKDGYYYTITLTDLAPYLEKFNAKYGTTYVVNAAKNEGISYVYTLKFTPKNTTTVDYSNGTWKADYTGWTTQDKNNGKQLWVLPGGTVTFEDGADGVIFESVSETLALGAATPTHETEYEGYTFNGWSPELSDTVTGDVTYTASFTAKEYLVFFDTNGGESTIGKYLRVTYGQTYGDLLEADDLDGYTTEGWFVMNADGSLGEQITEDTLVNTARDHVLILARAIAEPEVTIETEDNNWELTYAPNTTVTMTVDTTQWAGLAYGYQWYKDGETIEGATDKELTVDVTVANSGTYKVEVTAYTKSRAATIITTNTSATGSAEQTLTVTPAENTVKLVYNPGIENGSTTYTVDEGFVIALEDSLNMTWAGHTATTTWTTNEDGTGDRYTTGDSVTFESVNGGESVTLYLQWTTNPCTVTFQADGETVSTITKAYGEKLTESDYPAVPELEGYTGEWVKYTEEITEDVIVEAVYTAVPTEDENATPADPATPSDTTTTPGTTNPAQTTNGAETPKTGDAANLVLWISLLTASVIAMCLFFATKLAKRKTK